MIALFLQYMTYVVKTSFQDHMFQPLSEYGFEQDIFDIYASIRHLHELFGHVPTALIRWRETRYYGGEWSQLQRQFEFVYGAFMVLEYKLDRITLGPLWQQMRPLREELRGMRFAKRDVFQVWKSVVQSNAQHHASYWETLQREPVVRKRILIPHYSWLLPDVQRTSDLADVLESTWNRSGLFHGWYEAHERPPIHTLQFLPEVPPYVKVTDTNLHIPNIAIEWRMPEEDGQIDRLVGTIEAEHEALGQELRRIPEAYPSRFRQPISPLLTRLPSSAG